MLKIDSRLGAGVSGIYGPPGIREEVGFDHYEKEIGNARNIKETTASNEGKWEGLLIDIYDTPIYILFPLATKETEGVHFPRVCTRQSPWRECESLMMLVRK